jgi:hypothetical protein
MRVGYRIDQWKRWYNVAGARCVVAHGSVRKHCHEASHSSRASATGEKLVGSAYIGWIATLPIVPSVSPKSAPLA